MRYIFRPGLFDYDNDIEKVMPTTLVKTCWDKLQNNTYSVFLSAWQIGKPSPCWTTISRSSYPVFFRVTPELYTSVFKPKQYWIEGWGGGLLFSVFRRCFCGVKVKKKNIRWNCLISFVHEWSSWWLSLTHVTLFSLYSAQCIPSML